MSRVTPVILSGGEGTRLWPLSTPERPKQLLPLVTENSMLQDTLLRTSESNLFGPPVLVAAEAHEAVIRQQLEAIGIAPARLILEPAARNTAAAIALAALSAAGDDLLLVCPSDHLIRDAEGFREAIRRGVPAAEQGWIVTFGIRPHRPETGYGYINRGEALGSGVFRVARFVEKPDAATAAAYLADGTYDWNAGIFLFRASVMLEALRVHAADILDGTRRAVGVGTATLPDRQRFAAIRSQSIDHAVMERASQVAVVPADIGWSDVGSWDALHDVSALDSEGNAASGPVHLLDSAGCYVRSDGIKVVAVGCSDLVVIAAGDTVMIVPRGRSQRVKDAVEALKDLP